jgi:hypothetical protein
MKTAAYEISDLFDPHNVFGIESIAGSDSGGVFAVNAGGIRDFSFLLAEP